jgi:hypothetical protein
MPTSAEVVASDMKLLTQISRRLEGLSPRGKLYLHDQLRVELGIAPEPNTSEEDL